MKKMIISMVVLLLMFLMMTVSVHTAEVMDDVEGKHCSRHINWAYYYKKQPKNCRRNSCRARPCPITGGRCDCARKRRKSIAPAPTAVGIGNNRRPYQRPQVMNGQASGEGFAEAAEGFQSRSTKW